MSSQRVESLGGAPPRAGLRTWLKVIGVFAVYIAAIALLGVAARVQEWWKLGGALRWAIPIGSAAVLIAVAKTALNRKELT